MKRIGVFALFVLVLVCSGASAQELSDKAAVDGEIELEPPEGKTVFGYRGLISPARWALLTEEWEICGEGEMQSPIDLSFLDATIEDVPDLLFDYHESPVQIVNNGHTVKWDIEPGSSITLGGVEYELQQFHFHTPSEHTFQGGARFPLEAHLVHVSAAGDRAVVGVMIGSRKDHNNAFPLPRRFRQMVPTAEGIGVEFHGLSVDAEQLLPENRMSFRYDGSLTTPPCLQGVRWIVMTEPINLSRDQVDVLLDALRSLRFAGISGNNNRPTQPLHGRQVSLGE